MVDRGNEALSTDVVKLLKTQDMGYIKVQIAKDEKVCLIYCTSETLVMVKSESD